MPRPTTEEYARYGNLTKQLKNLLLTEPGLYINNLTNSDNQRFAKAAFSLPSDNRWSPYNPQTLVSFLHNADILSAQEPPNPNDPRSLHKVSIYLDQPYLEQNISKAMKRSTADIISRAQGLAPILDQNEKKRLLGDIADALGVEASITVKGASTGRSRK